MERKPRVLMIAPRGYQFVGIGGDHPYFRLTRTNRFWPPLGILTVAGHFPSDWDLRLVDENIRLATDDDFAQADYVLLSAIYPRIDRILHNAERAGAHGKPVVVGGPCAGRVALRRAEYPSITSICFHECDPYVQRLISDMEAGTLRPTYGDVPEQVDLTRSPVPAFHLLTDIKRYVLLAMQVSRGCPYTCDFCDVPEASGHKMRYKSPEQVVAELEALHQLVPRGQIFICDDNFVGHRGHAKAVLEAVAAWQVQKGYPFSFMSQLSLNVADDKEMLELLFKANLRNPVCGIESVHEESLREVGKQQNLKGSMRERIEEMTRAGIEVSAYLLLGFDNDPPDIARKQFEFVQEAKVPWAFVNILFASDNTPFGKRMLAEERLVFSADREPDRTVEYVTSGRTNFRTRMTPRALQESYAWMLEQLYLPRNWYRRTREMVELLPDRDQEQQLVPMRWSSLSVFIVTMALVFCPSRLLLLREAWRLYSRTRQSWRVWRFFYSAFSTGITSRDSALMARRIRESLARPAPPADLPEPTDRPALPAA